MANDIVYERDYREVHKIMSARTFTEEKEEAFQLALQSGVYKSIGERIHELPHVLNPIKKDAYEKCLVVLEKYAAQWGGVIKLIGKCKMLESGLMDIVVAPMFVPCTSQLANINDVFNGVMVRGDCTGDVVFYGKGAGMLPTASAVVADTVDCCKHLKARKRFFWIDTKGEECIADYKESLTRIYLRLNTCDKDAAYNKATELVGEITTLTRENAPECEFAFATTTALAYGKVLDAMEALKSEGMEILSAIRIGDL